MVAVVHCVRRQCCLCVCILRILLCNKGEKFFSALSGTLKKIQFSYQNFAIWKTALKKNNKVDRMAKLWSLISLHLYWYYNLGLQYEPPHEKPTICIGENKDADQLCGNREADQRLRFSCSDSTIPLQLISEISSF